MLGYAFNSSRVELSWFVRPNASLQQQDERYWKSIRNPSLLGLACHHPAMDQSMSGDFDLVGVGRALLQDPLWAKKVKEGRTTE